MGQNASAAADKRVIAFARTANLPIVHAIGVVEAIRQICLVYVKSGGIGKYSNQAIADWIGYGGDPDHLVDALTTAGCIVRDDEVRLRVKVFCWKGGRRARRRDHIRAAGGEVTTALRAEILERDNRRCRVCGEHRDLTMDHVVPVSAGGKTTRENLQTLCRPCNSRKKDW